MLYLYGIKQLLPIYIGHKANQLERIIFLSNKSLCEKPMNQARVYYSFSKDVKFC